MSKDVSTAFKSAMKRNQIEPRFMAKDTAQTQQAISGYATGYRNMPIDKAETNANYLDDPKFNTQMAASFFKTIAMYSEQLFSEPDNPFLTAFIQRREERERSVADDHVYEILGTNKARWSSEDLASIKEWLMNYIDEIAVEHLHIYQVAENAGIDLNRLIQEFNRNRGDV